MRRLLIRPGAMGDTVVWLPAAGQWLKGVEGEIWCAGANRALVRHLAAARAIEGSGLELLELPGMGGQTAVEERLRAFDEVVSWYGSARPEFREAVEALGVKARWMETLPRNGHGVHAVDFYLEQAGAEAGEAPRIPAVRREGGYALIHPFSSSPRKNWPLERFREVAARLEGEMAVRWCVGQEESLEGAEQPEDAAALIDLLAGARVYVGNDSGPSHVAAAVGTPVVVMFGPTDAAVWSPRGASVTVCGFDTGPDVVAEAALRAGNRLR